MAELLQTNRMEAIALVLKAILDCYQRGIKSDEHKQKMVTIIRKVAISHHVTWSTLKVKIKSMPQDFHAAFCDPDLDPYKSDKVIRDRLNMLKQQLQHQMSDECQFVSTCPCWDIIFHPHVKLRIVHGDNCVDVVHLII